MGTPMAPNYANLYMAYLEENYIFKFINQPMYYRRYIDDVFMIYQHSKEALEDFQSQLNSLRPTIKFTFEYFTSKVTYLDINIIKFSDKLKVEPYFKPTNTFSYVLSSSYHYKSVFGGIYRGENIRLLRNSSDESTYLENMKQLNECRGYGKVITHYSLEPFCNRNQYLFSRPKPKTETLTIVCTLDQQKKFCNVLKENWAIFSRHQDTRKNLYSKPLAFSYVNHPNIEQKVSRTNIQHIITDPNTTLYSIPTMTIQTVCWRNRPNHQK